MACACATLAPRRAPPRARPGGRLPSLDLDTRTTVAYINDGKMLLALRSPRYRLTAAAAAATSSPAATTPCYRCCSHNKHISIT